VVRLGTVPIGSLVVRGDTSPLTNNAIASLIAITFDRYRAFANESRIETERRTEQLRATVLDSLAHAYKTPLTAIRAASTGLSEMGHLSPGQAELVALIDEQTGCWATDHAPADHGAPRCRRSRHSCGARWALAR
jgi:two-component system, OmpR family, sensor histidine kinase KdpD